MTILQEEVALKMLEVIPLVMRNLRAEMRKHRQTGLSVPQFRALAFLRGQPGASLNSLAEHVGLTPASTSKLVDVLVERGLVARQPCSEDRRRIDLSLTPAGVNAWQESFQHTQASLARCLESLGEADLHVIQDSMQVLRPLFSEGDR